MTYLWLKAFHLIAVVTWFAALFYLPRLFVYHSQALKEGDTQGVERFKTMERKLYRGIMNPSMVAVLLLGTGLLSLNFAGYLAQTWLQIKLGLIVLLLIYHFWCGILQRSLALDNNKQSETWYRVFNELPVFILIFVVLLAIIKPW
ncbi:protoporphyrinogen oxidase HemJ [Marinospirillum insulare]|uniref:Protoporphyrinogen IX oxidase n=1 Tax=Marinospirillum insulare TaxID=217169 RepID=A0ABQ5ZV81_9GAMM|nr:protoporphyrinogen oxidase HemJ [Marinospirillum insulare]GLR64071.1 membrane protein [Marinospirillum insulare]